VLATVLELPTVVRTEGAWGLVVSSRWITAPTPRRVTCRWLASRRYLATGTLLTLRRCLTRVAPSRGSCFVICAAARASSIDAMYNAVCYTVSIPKYTCLHLGHLWQQRKLGDFKGWVNVRLNYRLKGYVSRQYLWTVS